MALPRVKIYFENGALGSVAPGADGVVGLAVTAVAVPATESVPAGFQLNTAYVFRKLDDLVSLGVTPAVNDGNAFLYRHVKEFYAEAGDGAELWVMGFANTVAQSDIVNKDAPNSAKQLIQAAGGRIRALGVAYLPANGYTPTIANGVDSDLTAALQNGQSLGKWATEALYAPLFVLLEARHYTGVATALSELSENSYDRVGVFLGDTVKGSNGAAVGLLLGRVARIPVQRHIGRVRDNALNTLTAYLKDVPAELADVETVHDKGFITFRTFVGKAGYFFSDDFLATAVTDDYRSIARRRTIDKAYRIAYQTLINFLNEEIPITESGELVPAMVKSWESEVESAIITQMTAEGNLGVDTTEAQDTGVQCFIDYAQKVVSTGKVEVVLRVKPYGYAKYIDVKLGFVTMN
jgi:hypothetical protein